MEAQGTIGEGVGQGGMNKDVRRCVRAAIWNKEDAQGCER